MKSIGNTMCTRRRELQVACDAAGRRCHPHPRRHLPGAFETRETNREASAVRSSLGRLTTNGSQVGDRPIRYWGDESPGEGPARIRLASRTRKTSRSSSSTECAHLRIEGLKIRNCWPSILFLKNSCHVVIRNCTLRDGTFAIVAKDTPKKARGRRICWSTAMNGSRTIPTSTCCGRASTGRGRMAAKAPTGCFATSTALSSTPRASAAMSWSAPIASWTPITACA